MISRKMHTSGRNGRDQLRFTYRSMHNLRGKCTLPAGTEGTSGDSPTEVCIIAGKMHTSDRDGRDQCDSPTEVCIIAGEMHTSDRGEVFVRQTRCLPQTSFRFHLTMDTLVFGCTLPTVRACWGLAPVRICPCRAN